jgi:general secretion pathway protein D
MRFNPGSVDAATGGTFTVSIMVDNVSDVVSAPVQLTFDPKMLRLNDVSAGDLFSRGGVTPTVTKNIQNEAGRASIQVGRQGAPGANGNGAVLTLTFSAVSAGQTQIVAPNLALRNSQGQPAGTGSPVLNVRIR